MSSILETAEKISFIYNFAKWEEARTALGQQVSNLSRPQTLALNAAYVYRAFDRLELPLDVRVWGNEKHQEYVFKWNDRYFFRGIHGTEQELKEIIAHVLDLDPQMIEEEVKSKREFHADLRDLLNGFINLSDLMRKIDDVCFEEQPSNSPVGQILASSICVDGDYHDSPIHNVAGITGLVFKEQPLNPEEIEACILPKEGWQFYLDDAQHQDYSSMLALQQDFKESYNYYKGTSNKKTTQIYSFYHHLNALVCPQRKAPDSSKEQYLVFYHSFDHNLNYKSVDIFKHGFISWLMDDEGKEALRKFKMCHTLFKMLGERDDSHGNDTLHTFVTLPMKWVKTNPHLFDLGLSKKKYNNVLDFSPTPWIDSLYLERELKKTLAPTQAVSKPLPSPFRF